MKRFRIYVVEAGILKKFHYRPKGIPHSFDEFENAILAIRSVEGILRFVEQQFVIQEYKDSFNAKIVAISTKGHNIVKLAT